MTSDAALPTRSGLSVALDIIVAPKAAFEALRARPHWGWAFFIVCVLGTLGAYLQVPAAQHLTEATIAHRAATDPAIGGLSPEKLRASTQLAVTVQGFAFIFYPLGVLVAIALAAGLFAVANAFGNGDASFARLFGLSANVAIVNFGLHYLIVGVLAHLREPADFTSARDLLTLVPSFANVVPGDAPKLAAFLASFNPFQLWSWALIYAGLRAVARIPAGVAFATVALIALGSAALGLLAVR